MYSLTSTGPRGSWPVNLVECVLDLPKVCVFAAVLKIALALVTLEET